MANTHLNPDLIDTATPPIPEAAGWLADYDGRLGPAINLSQAVPGDPPPDAFLKRIASAAATPEATRYGDIFGDHALRIAYAAECSRVYGARIAAEEVAITAGCNQAFFDTVLAVATAGDAVLLPSPWYFNHKMALDMLGIEARPLPLSAANGFIPDVDDAAALIDDKLKAIVLVTPNNPTGAVYPPHVLSAFMDLARQKGLWLIIDETYRDFLPGDAEIHDLFARPEWRETVISLYSFSKSYAIPGHRLGAVIAGAPVLDQIGKILDTIQICPPRAVQMALPWAFENLAAWQRDVKATIRSRILAFREALEPHPGWVIDQIGAYFAYVRHPFPGIPATAVAERLARECGLLALPGSYFGPGQDTHLRMAFANVDTPEIARIGDRLGNLSVPASNTAVNWKDYRHG